MKPEQQKNVTSINDLQKILEEKGFLEVNHDACSNLEKIKESSIKHLDCDAVMNCLRNLDPMKFSSMFLTLDHDGRSRLWRMACGYEVESGALCELLLRKCLNDMPKALEDIMGCVPRQTNILALAIGHKKNMATNIVGFCLEHFDKLEQKLIDNLLFKGNDTGVGNAAATSYESNFCKELMEQLLAKFSEKYPKNSNVQQFNRRLKKDTLHKYKLPSQGSKFFSEKNLKTAIDVVGVLAKVATLGRGR